MRLGTAMRALASVAIPPVLAVAGMVSLTIMTTATSALADSNGKKYVERFEQTEKLAADGKVFLVNISGDVIVKTWDRTEVRIEATKTSEASSLEKAKENAREVKIDIERENGQLNIQTKYPEGRVYKKNISVSVEYVLTVPSKAGVTVVTVSGTITAENIGGLAKLTAVSGDVNVNKAARGGVFAAVDGDVELSDVKGDVEINSVSGNVTLNGVAGDVEAAAVSGDIKVVDLSGAESVDIEVQSGAIDFAGTLSPTGRYSLQTHSGPIVVRLPRNAAFDFTCETFSGTISSDFKAAGETQVQRKRHRQDAHGQVNGGGADLTIQTFSGSISLEKMD